MGKVSDSFDVIKYHCKQMLTVMEELPENSGRELANDRVEKLRNTGRMFLEQKTAAVSIANEWMDRCHDLEKQIGWFKKREGDYEKVFRKQFFAEQRMKNALIAKRSKRKMSKK